MPSNAFKAPSHWTLRIAFFVLSILLLSIPVSAQKGKSLSRLLSLADTLIAHNRCDEAFHICDSVIDSGNQVAVEVYERATEAGLACLPSKRSKYSEFTSFMKLVHNYALFSQNNKLIIRTFRNLLGLCESEEMDNTGMNFCDLAQEYVDSHGEDNPSFKGYIMYMRGLFYQNQRDIAAAVNYFKLSVFEYERAGEYGEALNSCCRLVYLNPRIGTSRYSMDFWNITLDKYYDMANKNNMLTITRGRFYYIAKAYYYNYIKDYKKALDCWDSSFAAYQRHVEVNNLVEKSVKYKPRNLMAYNYGFRIEFLYKLGNHEEIERIADFASDTTDLRTDDLACLEYQIGKYYGDKHQYNTAFKFLKKSYEHYRLFYSEINQVTFVSLLKLLRYSIASGNYEYGLKVARDGIESVNTVFMSGEGAKALELMEQTAALELLSNRRDSVEKYLIAADSIFSSMLNKNFGYLSDLAFNDLWSRADITCSHLLQMATELDDISPEFAKSVFRSVITQKTLYFVSQNHLKKCAESSEQNRLLYRNIAFLRKMVTENKKDFSSDLLDSMYRVSKVCEAMLLANDTIHGHINKVLSASHESISKMMEEGDVMVEFSEVFEYDQELLDVIPQKCTYPYVAVVFDNKCETPVVIRLFDRKELVDHVLHGGVTLREALSRRSPNDIMAIYTDTTLTRMIWGRIIDRFPDAKSFYFSPTGIMNAIAMENLMDASGEVMSSKYNMVRVFSTAFYDGWHSRNPLKDIALFGGINYGLGVDGQMASAEHYAALDFNKTKYRLQNADSTRYEYLPATLEECDYVLQRSGQSLEAHLHTGDMAVEESLKAYSGRSPSILHIATHGYYNPKDSSANFLNMSGLVFAGANNRLLDSDLPQQIDDGILTASEISELDFSDTYLAVLSACETGLGVINSNGLFGLMRGFKLAGVQKIVMSMWNVSDEATSLFMRRFYTHLLSGHSAAESLKYARNYLRLGNRFNHPYYWAGFVLVE